MSVLLTAQSARNWAPPMASLASKSVCVDMEVSRADGAVGSAVGSVGSEVGAASNWPPLHMISPPLEVIVEYAMMLEAP